MAWPSRTASSCLRLEMACVQVGRGTGGLYGVLSGPTGAMAEHSGFCFQRTLELDKFSQDALGVYSFGGLPALRNVAFLKLQCCVGLAGPTSSI